MYIESLVIAATPAAVFAGSALAYYGFTERGDHDPVPRVRRGDSVNEPWWNPEPISQHVLPGSVVMQLPRDHGLDGKTAEYDIITDERTNEDDLQER